MKLVLIGFMGAGKSTVGHLLAESLGYASIEMDDAIVEASPCASIADIFEQHGELYFRALETDVAYATRNVRQTILSTGGGVVETPETMLWLTKGADCIIWLRSSFETLSRRVGGDPARPLFTEIELAHKRWSDRRSMYARHADLILDTDDCEPHEIVQQIKQACVPSPVVNASTWSIPAVSGHTQLCVIIGDPVSHSLSPTLHNSAYAAAGLNDQYVYVAAHVSRGHIKDAVQAARNLHFRGLTCTIPHKTDILPFLDTISPAAHAIGAVNTVVLEDGLLKGWNTDWLGIYEPLRRLSASSAHRAAIVGAGGTTRAALYALQQLGVTDVTIFNRTLSKAQELAESFGCRARPLEAAATSLSSYDIIVQTTSVGMSPHMEQSPVPAECFRPHQIVLDAIYTPFETRLLRDALRAGATIVRGADMFLEQAIAQFKHYTQQEAPREVMEQVICAHFGVSSLSGSPR